MNVEKYNQVAKEVCGSENIAFVDMYSEFMKQDYKNLLFDGLHPNDEGHELMFQVVKKFLQENEII